MIDFFDEAPHAFDGSVALLRGWEAGTEDDYDSQREEELRTHRQVSPPYG